MVNEERLAQMIRMAKRDTPRQRKALKIARYYRSDYIAMGLIREFFLATIAYILLVGLLAVLFFDTLVSSFVAMNLTAAIAELVIGYIIFLGIYLGIVFLMRSSAYTKAKKVRKSYDKDIKKLDRMYQKEEEHN